MESVCETAKLSNTIADAHLERSEPATLRRDQYYDALTVRILADGRDVTADARGKVVGGSQPARWR